MLRIALVSAVLLATCSATARAAWRAEHVRSIAGFDVPECVAVHPQSGNAYVSSIVAEVEGEGVDRFWADDGDGFLSRMEPRGKGLALRWQRSTRSMPLNCPKGMCVLAGRLWVADNTRVVSYALAGSQAGPRDLAVAGAQWINDLAADGTHLLASDTGRGVIYRIKVAPDGAAEVAATLKAPQEVNGVTVHGGKRFAVSWGLHEAYELDPKGKADPEPFGVAEHFKTLDGIEVLSDGGFLVSDLQGNKVAVIAADRKTVRTLIEVTTPADIGLDRNRMLLYVPSFATGRVEVYRLAEK